MTDLNRDETKKVFFEKKKLKMADTKNWDFQLCKELTELKISVFLCRPFEFFFEIKIFFASSLYKLVIIYVIPRIGRNFDDYLDFSAKSSEMIATVSHCMIKAEYLNDWQFNLSTTNFIGFFCFFRFFVSNSCVSLNFFKFTTFFLDFNAFLIFIRLCGYFIWCGCSLKDYLKLIFSISSKQFHIFFLLFQWSKENRIYFLLLLTVFKSQFFFSIWILIYYIWETFRNKLKNWKFSAFSLEFQKFFSITGTIFFSQ